MKPAKGKKKELAKHGRYGDDRVVHVNAMEEAILKAMGGAGTRNPKTGLREYYETEGADATDRFGGADTNDFGNYSESEARDTGFYGAEYNPNDASFNPDSSPAGPPGTPGRAAGTGFAHAISTALASDKPSWATPASRMTYEATRALGDYVGRPINDYFGGNAADRAPPSFSNEQGGRNDALSAAMGVQPAVQQAPSFMRPPETPLPANLGLPSGLSDLQKRTMISTYGTQGAQSQYRTPEAMRAYGNLIARALIGDNNQVAGGEPGTLPIEDQYLRQAFGINKPNSASALLEALRPYWSA